MGLAKTHLLNRLLLVAGKLSHYRYYSSLSKVDVIQKRKLLKYISKKSSTEYSRTFNFKNIKSYSSFAKEVPIIEEWSQLEPYIKRIEKGEKNILCVDAIDSFEETSGSTGFSKLIPYNKALKREFEMAVQVWMLDLYATFPQAFYGKSYCRFLLF